MSCSIPSAAISSLAHSHSLPSILQSKTATAASLIKVISQSSLGRHVCLLTEFQFIVRRGCKQSKEVFNGSSHNRQQSQCPVVYTGLIMCIHWENTLLFRPAIAKCLQIRLRAKHALLICAGSQINKQHRSGPTNTRIRPGKPLFRVTTLKNQVGCYCGSKKQVVA